MAMTIHEKLGRLARPPLAEAIFELRWELQPNQTDPAWQLLPGLCYGQLRDDFPAKFNLPASNIPAQMTPYVVRQQFRPAADKWPVIQLGPGILTVNHATGYTDWNSFLPVVRKALGVLNDAFPDDTPFEPVHLELRYLNAVPYQFQKDHLLKFMKSNLHTTIQISPRPFDGERVSDGFDGFNLTLTFPTNKPKGTGQFLFADGIHQGEPAVVWHMAIQSKADHVPDKVGLFDCWLNDAHLLIEHWFVDLTQGPLLKSFKQEVTHD
ncbi:MAG TPA: TIGR04255 family protein [Pirellulales bacterium]|nr:TIGR04255 family protein [Pirellulales bacterium]